MCWKVAKQTGMRLAERLLPTCCVFCGDTSAGSDVCRGCYRALPWITHACARCGTPLASPLPTGVVCAACQQRPPPFETTIAPLHYDFPVNAVIKAFKFGRKLYLAPALASLALPALVRCANHFEALVPVPLYRWRHATRGFNQAHELAKYFRRCTGLPVRHCAVRTRRTEPQSGLDAVTRRRNMRGAFKLIASPKSKRVLIIDDVMTTGETCRALASALLAGGVEHVGVVAIAHASP